MIYLDNNATTPLDPRVFDAMNPYFLELYSNASSTHRFGIKAKHAVEKARQSIADLIQADPKEIVYTSGSTEAINLALKGVASQSKKKHIITVQTEHSAVLDTVKYLEETGMEVSYLSVDKEGKIDLQDLQKTIRPDTLLVSIMYANNETGLIHPIKAIAKIAHEAGALMMTDASQSTGKIPIDVDELGIDLMTLSAHKFYGPKGIGCLYVRNDGEKKLSLAPLIHGGGHENFMRSGTLNVPGIVGFGAAAELAIKEMKDDKNRIRKLRDRLESSLLHNIPGSWVNGSTKERHYNVSNMGFTGLDANVLIAQLKDIAVSNGSACTSAVFEPSHVLMAMGLSEEEAFESLRFSLGRFTTEEEIEEAVRVLERMILRVSMKRS